MRRISYIFVILIESRLQDVFLSFLSSTILRVKIHSGHTGFFKVYVDFSKSALLKSRFENGFLKIFGHSMLCVKFCLVFLFSPALEAKDARVRTFRKEGTGLKTSKSTFFKKKKPKSHQKN